MSDGGDEKPKPGLLRRWFGGGAPAASEPVEPEALPEAEPPAPKKSWFRRLTEGLSRSSSAIGRGISDIFAKRKLDAARGHRQGTL